MRTFMIVYDFDGTIYDGDCSLDFYFFCLCRRPTLLRYLPWQLKGMMSYYLGFMDKTKYKEHFFYFLSDIVEIQLWVDQFWRIYERKLKQWYMFKKHEQDVIISASPRFLLEPICNKLGVRDLIASEVDAATGSFKGVNCFGRQKVLLFNEKYPSEQIDEFYSDSLHDAPLADLALKAYIVKGRRILMWPLKKGPCHVEQK